MHSIEVMVSEHDNIKKLLKVVRKACLDALGGNEICVADFELIIDFIKGYADELHHGKEEKFLFNEMKQHLGKIGTNIITHGMLVEHELGRLHIIDLEAALMDYKITKSAESKLDIIASAVSYTKLLHRHIDKENDVIYTYAEKNLPSEVLASIDKQVKENEKNETNLVAKYNNLLLKLAEKYQ